MLPHWGHLFRFEACQRFAALRVRNRILDVLRFGTPMAGGYESIFNEENNVEALKNLSFRAKSRNAVLRPEGSSADCSTPLRMTTLYLNDLTSTYLADSNLILALYLAQQSSIVSLCKHDSHLCRNVDALAG